MCGWKIVRRDAIEACIAMYFA